MLLTAPKHPTPNNRATTAFLVIAAWTKTRSSTEKDLHHNNILNLQKDSFLKMKLLHTTKQRTMMEMTNSTIFQHLESPVQGALLGTQDLKDLQDQKANQGVMG